MSATVTTFTEQDFAPGAAKVFDAVRQFGSAMIRTQKGDTFVVQMQPNEGSDDVVPDFPARWKRLREMGNVPPPASENDRINRIIAGEL